MIQYYLILVKVAVIKLKKRRKKEKEKVSAGEDEEKSENLYIVHRNIKWYSLHIYASLKRYI